MNSSFIPKNIDYVRVFMFILIAIIIFNQIRIVKILVDKQEMLDTDPLVYSANRYDIEYCTCIISPTRTIEFTKNYSKTIINRISDYDPAIDFDFMFDIYEKEVKE